MKIARMPYEVGDDGFTWMWACPSFTTSGVEYEIHVSRDGYIQCTCMDATCRKKYGIITDSDKLCKHCKLVLRLLKIREPNEWAL